MKNEKQELTPSEIQEQISIGLNDFNETYKNPPSNIISERRALLASDLGILYWKLDNFSESRRYFFIALDEFEQLQDDFKVATTKGSLGSLYLQFGEYNLAENMIEEAYQYWMNKSHLNERIACLQNLAIIALKKADESKATDFVLKALKMAIQLQDETQFAITIQILLEYYEKQKRYDILFELKRKSLEFWDQMQISDRQYKTLVDLGVLSQILDDYEMALVYFKKAFNIAFHGGDLEKMYLAQGFIGECYVKLGNVEAAKKVYIETFKIAVYINGKRDFQDQVNSMQVVLLTLGMTQDDIIIEAKKAQKEQ